MFCENCGNKIEDKAKFCYNCGEKVTYVDTAETISSFSYKQTQSENSVKQNEKCQKCGHIIEENSKFCDYCGEMVTHNDAVAAEPINSFSYEKAQSENSVNQMGNCPKCGHIIEGNSAFCDYCGTPIGSTPKKISSVTPKQSFAAAGTPYGNTSVMTNIKKPIIIILIIFILLIVGTAGILFVYNNHKEKTITSTTHQNIVEKNVQTEAIAEKSVTATTVVEKTTAETTVKAESAKEKSNDVYFSIDDIVSASGIRLSDWELYEISDLSCDNGSANADIETVGSEVTVNNVLGVNVSDADSGTVTISGTIKSMHIVTRENIGIINAFDTDSKYFSVTKTVGNLESDNKQLADSYVGKWECQELKSDGLTLSGVFEGIPVAAMIQMELKKDGTGTIMAIGEDSEKIYWQAEGDTVSVEFDGETIIFNKDGDRIVASSKVIDGTKMVLTLVKVDKFTKYENVIISNLVNNMRGQINCHGGTVSGFTTDYVVNGGAVERVRNSLGDTWHVTAKNVCTNYGVTWYELWDSDDGDYYGWVDSSYIDFY